MYKFCIVGLSIIFILSINGVLSEFLCGRFEGSWVFTTDPALQLRNFGIGKVHDNPKDKFGSTVKIAGTPITPVQAVWYPELRHRNRGRFFPYAHYFVLKLHQFTGNELSLVDTSVNVEYKKQVGMLLCKKFDGECGQNYDGQVSYVEDGDEIGIYIIPEDRYSLAVHYFINGVLTEDSVRLDIKSFKTLFPAVTFTKPGFVTMKERRDEPPAQLVKDIEFLSGRTPVVDYNTLMDHVKSEKPNNSEVFDVKGYRHSWIFRDGFIVCKNDADQSEVPRLTESKRFIFSLEVHVKDQSEKAVSFDYIFFLTKYCRTVIERDLVNNTWSKFGPVVCREMWTPPDVEVLENWLTKFLSSANIVFLGPKGKSLHIADDKCAINLMYRRPFGLKQMS